MPTKNVVRLKVLVVKRSDLKSVREYWAFFKVSKDRLEQCTHDGKPVLGAMKWDRREWRRIPDLRFGDTAEIMDPRHRDEYRIAEPEAKRIRPKRAAKGGE